MNIAYTLAPVTWHQMMYTQTLLIKGIHLHVTNRVRCTHVCTPEGFREAAHQGDV